MNKKLLRLAKEFASICEMEGIHGLPFQHISLCERRAWLHLKRIDYFHLEDRMAKGKVLHNNSKQRDNSVKGLMGLSPDRIDWENHIVYEAKGGAGAKDAAAAQTAYYAIMLIAATEEHWQAVNDIIPQKRERAVTIDEDVVISMLKSAQQLSNLNQQNVAPKAERIEICTSCSYRFLCGYD